MDSSKERRACWYPQKHRDPTQGSVWKYFLLAWISFSLCSAMRVCCNYLSSQTLLSQFNMSQGTASSARQGRPGQEFVVNSLIEYFVRFSPCTFKKNKRYWEISFLVHTYPYIMVCLITYVVCNTQVDVLTKCIYLLTEPAPNNESNF